MNVPLIMPINKASLAGIDYASEYDHDFEEASPHHYSVLLEKYDIKAEYTVTEHCVIYRFVSIDSDSISLLLIPNDTDLEVVQGSELDERLVV